MWPSEFPELPLSSLERLAWFRGVASPTSASASSSRSLTSRNPPSCASTSCISAALVATAPGDTLAKVMSMGYDVRLRCPSGDSVGYSTVLTDPELLLLRSRRGAEIVGPAGIPSSSSSSCTLLPWVVLPRRAPPLPATGSGGTEVVV